MGERLFAVVLVSVRGDVVVHKASESLPGFFVLRC